jgi:trehalose 6-phosphate phosphatase
MQADDHRPPLPDPGRTALFLDFDGTLVGIAPTPEAVRPAAGLADLLVRLRDRLGGALAVVSGRPVEQIDGFLAPARLAVAGLHGMDCRLPDGSRERMAADEHALAAARLELERFVAAHPAALIEDKGLTLALHYRGVPEAAEAARAAAGAGVAASGGALQIRPGKMVLELAPPGRTKGDAVRDLMRRPPFAGRVPVFCGDDVTDEDGFLAMLALGGQGIRIGPADRPTAATTRLDDVAALHRWLKALAEREDGPGSGTRRQSSRYPVS